MSLNSSVASSRQRFTTQLCGWSAVTLVFSAPFSRTLYILAGVLFVLGWVVQDNIGSRLKELWSLPVTPPALALVTLVLLWATWSPAPPGDVVNNLKVYSKLLLMLMLVSTLTDARWRQRAWWGFIAGMALVLASTLANVLIDLPWSRTQNQGLGVDHSVFVEYVSQSVMTAVFMALAIQRALVAANRMTRTIWILTVLIALGSVVFLLQGRSGLVAAATVAVVFAAIHTPPTKRFQTSLLLISAGTLLVVASPLMMLRIQQAFAEIANYQAFERTSLGLRMDMWRLALQTFVNHPAFGAGNGTYHQIAAQHFGYCSETCIHPHNQYLFFAMEYGVLGLLAFLWLLWSLAHMARRSMHPERSILFATTAVLAVDSLFNVPLWYRAESYFFYAVLGLVIASNLPTRAEIGPHILRADNLMKS